MSTDPLSRLRHAFGNVLVRYRRERKLTVEAVAAAVGWSTAEVASMECGDYAPSLKDLFRVASAFDEEPAILFIDVVAAWRSNDGVPMTRASDFARLYRLGYHHKPGDFREQERVYSSDAEAMHAADRLNQQRHQRGVVLLDTVAVYIRMGHIGITWTPPAGGTP